MIPRDMRERYERCIASNKWKAIRERALEKSYNADAPASEIYGNYRCQKCQWYFKKDQLEVHHRHYQTLGNEQLDDLMVLCTRCHKHQDEVRAAEGRRRGEDALEEARFAGWATKVYGEDWMLKYDPSDLADEFYDWVERKESEDYW